MTMTRMFTVTCDECLISADESHWWSSVARDVACKLGWTRRGKRDLCPECSESTDSNHKRDGSAFESSVVGEGSESTDSGVGS